MRKVFFLTHMSSEKTMEILLRLLAQNSVRLFLDNLKKDPVSKMLTGSFL
jgi:hypothetical protein